MPIPRSITCNLCGAQHLKTSFAIHYKACQKMHPEEFARLKKQVQKREAVKKKAAAAQQKRGGGHVLGAKEEKESIASAVTLTSMAEYLPEFADEDVIRYACKICGRKFLKDRLAKHEQICIKISKKRKRKAYDGSRHRVQGTPFAEFENRRSETPREIREWKARGGRRWRDEVKMLREIAGLKPIAPSIKSDRSAINRKPLRAKKADRKASGVAGAPRKIGAGAKSKQTAAAGLAGSPVKRRRGSKKVSGKEAGGGGGGGDGGGARVRRDSRGAKENSTAGVNRRSFTKEKDAVKFAGLKESNPNKTAAGSNAASAEDTKKPSTSMAQYIEREKKRAAAQNRGRRGMAGH